MQHNVEWKIAKTRFSCCSPSQKEAEQTRRSEDYDIEVIAMHNFSRNVWSSGVHVELHVQIA